MIWFLLACGDESNLKEDSATEITFENEDILSLGGERYTGYYLMDMIQLNGFMLPFEAPASTYEIVEISIDVFTGADNCTSSINLFTIATEDPLEITELTQFYAYGGLRPYVFPEIPNSRSGVMVLTSESNPTPSDLEDSSSSAYEFSLRFDSPLLVEDSTPFWVGVGLHEGERACPVTVDIDTQSGFVFSEGQAFTVEDLGYDGLIKMRAKVRY